MLNLLLSVISLSFSLCMRKCRKSLYFYRVEIITGIMVWLMAFGFIFPLFMSKIAMGPSLVQGLKAHGLKSLDLFYWGLNPGRDREFLCVEVASSRWMFGGSTKLPPVLIKGLKGSSSDVITHVVQPVVIEAVIYTHICELCIVTRSLWSWIILLYRICNIAACIHRPLDMIFWDAIKGISCIY